jgi:hypothetical protein
MASYDWAATRSYLKHGFAKRTYATSATFPRWGTDQAVVAIRLRKANPDITSVTSIVNTTATLLTITSVGGNSDSAVYSYGTHSTVGKLANAINDTGDFEAKVVDALRTDATASAFTDGAVCAYVMDGENVWDLNVDIPTTLTISNLLTFDEGFKKSHKAKHRVHLEEIKYYIDTTKASGSYATLSIYERDIENVETLRYQVAASDTTVMAVNWCSGKGYITADNGGELLVRLTSTSSIARGAYIDIVGEIE